MMFMANITVHKVLLCGPVSTSVPTEPLPRGRHRLSRETVVTSQRARLLRGMAEAVAERGYVHTSVAQVLRRAHVSRETFYEHFSSKEDCFLAAYDAGVVSLQRGMRAEYESAAGTDPLERFRHALGAYLAALAGDPAFARTCLVEIYAVGPEALGRRDALRGGFVDLIATALGARDEDRFACEALVAAVSALVTERVAAGRAEELPALRDPLVDVARRMVPRR